MTYLALTLSLLAVVVAAHTFIFALTARWHRTQVILWHLDPDEARALQDAPPWFVRYAARLP